MEKEKLYPYFREKVARGEKISTLDIWQALVLISIELKKFLERNVYNLDAYRREEKIEDIVFGDEPLFRENLGYFEGLQKMFWGRASESKFARMTVLRLSKIGQKGEGFDGLRRTVNEIILIDSSNQTPRGDDGPRAA